MNQLFSDNQLFEQCKLYELRKENISKADFKDSLKNVSYQITEETFAFNITKRINIFLVEDLAEKMVLRKLNDNIKRLYKDIQSNRRNIISQVSVLLLETCPFWILKTDIKSFYENIDREFLLNKFQNDAMLSYHSLFLLKKLFSQPQFNNLIGLPRGICISATLSEIYMREIDNWLNREPGIYYYARFVDDIIIFAINKDIIDSVKVKLKNKLNDKKLTINLQKTSILNGNDIKKEKPLEYLGYKFCVSKNKKSKRVVISIADKKIAKFKTRIILSFLDYFKNNDFDLLKNRLVLLSGNFHLRENDDGVFLNAGIYYSYSQINDYTALSELNMFYRKIIYSKKGRFGNNIVNSISEDQKRILLKYSFKFGFINKVCHL